MRCFKCLILLGLAALPDLALAQSGNPLNGLERIKSCETARSSSSDPNWRDGNGDARSILPGQTLVIADLKGPGRITHIWNTIAALDKWAPRLVTIRMYWDGETNPSVECPLGDFFAVGHGIDAYVNSLPVRVTSEGRARNCYWPMPFRKSAKITVTNEGFKAVNAFYFYVDWQKLETLPNDTAYFHAQYRQEFPCVKGSNYLILDAEGQGHYVGTVQSVRLNENGWYGEGDDFFYIDGEKEPSLKGTGSEDYFCDAWGFRKLDGLYYGVPIMEGFAKGDRITAYRWHIPDPVVFKKSLKVEIEHKGSRDNVGGYVERYDDFSTVAFWYQVEPHKKFTQYPEGKDRLYFDPRAMIEMEGLLPVAKSNPDGRLQVQEANWCSSGGQVFFTPPTEGGSFDFRINVSEEGEYDITVLATRAFDYGIYEILIDGRLLKGPVDFYNTNLSSLEHSAGTAKLTKGEHVLTFRNKGKNPMSAGYYAGIDAVYLKKLR